MKKPRWLRNDIKPRLREEKTVEGLDANEPRKPHGSYRLREVKENPAIKEAEVRHSEATPRFRKEPVKIDLSKYVRSKKTKPHLREEKPVEKEAAVRGKAKKFNPEQYAKHAEINRRLLDMRHPNKNRA